jgi:cell division protein FtsI/penicillin-binding protein 2
MKRTVALVFALATAPPALGASLYEQSISRILASRFSSPAVSYLFLDARTGTVTASRWKDDERPVPLGSLVKPFTALAYAQRHEFRYPEFTCPGSGGRCWLPQGHGRIGMTEAIAFSCNAYFRELASKVDAEDVGAVVRRFGIRSTPQGLPARALAGLSHDWKVSPEEIARAYCQLARQSSEPGVAELVRGMALSAQVGTASAVGRALPGAEVLAKTGTAPCLHQNRAPGDGYAIALYPAESPRWAVLVRLHGATGAQAAAVGGEMLRAALQAK